MEVEAEVSTLVREVQKLAQECNKGKQKVALLDDAFKLEGGEVGRLSNNTWLIRKLDQDKAAEAHVDVKRCNLKARLATANTGQAMALGALEKGVSLLVALEQGLWEKAARLARQRRCARPCETQSGGGPLPRRSWMEQPVSCVKDGQWGLEKELEEKDTQQKKDAPAIKQLEGQGDAGVNNGAERRKN